MPVFRPITRVSSDRTKIETDPRSPLVLGPFGLGYSKPAKRYRGMTYCYQVELEMAVPGYLQSIRSEYLHYFVLGLWTRKQRYLRVGWDWKSWLFGVDCTQWHPLERSWSAHVGPFYVRYALMRR